MPHQSRDTHGAARAVAYLMLAAGVYNLVTSVLMKLGDPLPQVIVLAVISVGLFVTGLICLHRPHLMPGLFWLLVPFVSIAMIGGLNVATKDATLGPQILYLWPLLYTALLLRRAAGAFAVIEISAFHAATVLLHQADHQGLLDWIAITVAMAMTALVVTSLREHNDKLHAVLESQATSDSLTGAANRRGFDAELGRAVVAAGPDDPRALVMIDVDHFKTINDTWGHAVGDQALRAVAEALRGAADGRQHMVARLGGDEFAVLLHAGPYAAFQFAEAARTLVSAVDLPSGPPRLSIGIAAAPDHATNGEELQRAADSALYQAKAGGRGRSMIARTGPARQNVDLPGSRGISTEAAPAGARQSTR